MYDLKDLLAKRAKAVEDARALATKAREEKRAMSGEEQAQFDAFIGEADTLKGQVEEEQRLRVHEQEVGAFKEGEDRAAFEAAKQPKSDAMAGFRSWLRTGANNGEGSSEFRALSAGVDVEGGYLVAPEQFVDSLIKAADDSVFVRALATTYQVPSAMSLGAPELTADPSDADWTTELQTGSEDSAMRFGKRNIYPHALAKRIKISKDLMRRSVMSPETLVRDRLNYKFAITEEKAFLTGTGDKQPLGLFTASSNGISTSRDVAEDNTGTAFTVKGLINAKYSLKAQYQANAAWVFHRDGVKMLATLEDGDGRPLWEPSLQVGEPDRLLGNSLYMSEYAPNTFTTGKYVGMFGDFSHYWIVDAMNMQMQRLDELYAETNQVGFIARKETDGAPVLEEAFARVKLG